MAYLTFQIDDAVEGTSWSVIFDLTNTGWSNYDIDLLMHFLTLLKEYFPMSIDYVLAINFPWVLSTAWTFAKRFIPPERRDVVVFINDSQIFTYVDKENVPDFLGGTCQRDYVVKPKNCETTVGYLLKQKPEIPAKRIKDVIKVFLEVLPDNHGRRMYKELEDSQR